MLPSIIQIRLTQQEAILTAKLWNGIITIVAAITTPIIPVSYTHLDVYKRHIKT